MDLIDGGGEGGELARCKYKLRSIKKGEGEDDGVGGPRKRGPKPRLRSAGMSRYRRKEANARERQRQGEINTGFDKLREKIPHPGPSNGKCEKLRKIDILHVAIEYIRALESLLDTGEVGIHEFANSVYAVAGHGEDQEMEVKEGMVTAVKGGMTSSMVDNSDNATNCSDGGCSDESYDGEGNDFEGGSNYHHGQQQQQQQRQYSFFGGRHGSHPPSPRRITLSSREDVKPDLGLVQPHFVNQPPDNKTKPQFNSHQAQGDHLTSSKTPKIYPNNVLTQAANPRPPAFYQMNLNCKIYPTSSLKTEVLGSEVMMKPISSAFPDLRIDEFSDMSSSDPEDLFSDINSSLESLHHLDTFTFFNERHALPAFTI